MGHFPHLQNPVPTQNKRNRLYLDQCWGTKATDVKFGPNIRDALYSLFLQFCLFGTQTTMNESLESFRFQMALQAQKRYSMEK